METFSLPHSPLMSSHPSPAVLLSRTSGGVLGVKALDDSQQRRDGFWHCVGEK